MDISCRPLIDCDNDQQQIFMVQFRVPFIPDVMHQIPGRSHPMPHPPTVVQ